MIAVRLNGVISRLRRQWCGPRTKKNTTQIDRSPEKMKKFSTVPRTSRWRWTFYVLYIYV